LALNHVSLNASLLERSQLRYTPAGLPVLELQLQHQSSVEEAGVIRSLEFALDAVALGEQARALALVDLGSQLHLSGFLAPRSRRSTRLRIHVQQFSRLPLPEATAASQTQ
jgi:primosomal replication protein N